MEEMKLSVSTFKNCMNIGYFGNFNIFLEGTFKNYEYILYPIVNKTWHKNKRISEIKKSRNEPSALKNY